MPEAAHFKLRFIIGFLPVNVVEIAAPHRASRARCTSGLRAFAKEAENRLAASQNSLAAAQMFSRMC
jgi:hypothetical protein